jgi:hypothetical protein
MQEFGRHLQFVLSGAVAERLEVLRREWDPVMANRSPAHVSLVYPEEMTDERLLLERTSEAVAETAPFSISLGALVADEAGRGGIWFPVEDPSQTWEGLRAAILAPPFRPLPITPHATVVHPRTSARGAEAAAQLAGVCIAGAVTLSELVFTETGPSGMRVLDRFPLTAPAPVRVVAGLLRRDGRLLLYHRHPDRANTRTCGTSLADTSTPASRWRMPSLGNFAKSSAS